VNKPVTLLSVNSVEMDLAALWLPSRLGYLAFWPVTSRAVLGKVVKLRVAMPEPLKASE
jgi:hypothetical protein